MFDIEQVVLTNFKSFKGTHTFTLPTRPGLYLIMGRNEAEPRLEGNGAGKSTLLDAIVWCLYGQTPRGLRAGDIVTWGEKTAGVILKIKLGNEVVVIRRSQHPNALSIDNKVVEQKELDTRLRMGPDAFTYSVVTPQKHTHFFDLKASEKLDVFSQIMELDYWLARSQDASTRAAELSRKLFSLEGKLNGQKESINLVTEEIKTLQHKAAEYNDQQGNEIKRLKRELQAADTDLDGKEDNIRKKVELIKGFDWQIEEHTDSRDSQKKCLTPHVEKYSRICDELAICATAIRFVESQLKALGELGAQCPTCGQKLSGQHLKSEKVRLQFKLSGLVETKKDIDSKKVATQSFMSKIERGIEDKQQLIDLLLTDKKTVEGRINKLEADIAGLKAAREGLARELHKAKSGKNPYNEMVTEKKKSLKGLNETQDFDLKTKDQLDARHKSLEYWVSGFKKVRLFVIEDTLRSLELEVNNSLTSLGLSDWEIEFDVERENKTGGITKGFVVLIKNATHPEPVRFEAWSGGEAQRLQLAGDMGLSNLIMSQAGLVNKIEFYDEPSSYLSPQGLVDLAETLHERALNEGKKIMWIDHHSLDFGEFEDTYTVVKDKNGSSIIPVDGQT